MQMENIVIAAMIGGVILVFLWMLRLLVILAERYDNQTAKRILSLMDMVFSITILTDLLADFVKSILNEEYVLSIVYIVLLLLFIPICLLGPLGAVFGGKELAKRMREKMASH
ncbi:hypothetical protein [Laceyella putida]|uniref:Uncharacterized protein n=1 Tax=Laceyella putida TaxID=110101 RepID=A0ABW2RLS1_9BACL